MLLNVYGSFVHFWPTFLSIVCLLFLFPDISTGCSRFTPLEIDRDIKHFKQEEKMKMRQIRNFFVYLAVPLLHVFEDELGDFFLRQVFRLVNGIRAIGGFSVMPVEPKTLKKGKEYFLAFYRDMCDKDNYGSAYATYKHHNVSAYGVSSLQCVISPFF